MTTEYDKARNPDSKSKELGPGLASWDRLDALENAVTNLSIRQNKKMAELETYIRELNPGLCEPIPTAPAQNPLFDNKIETKKTKYYYRCVECGGIMNGWEYPDVNPEEPICTTCDLAGPTPSQAWNDPRENLEPNILLADVIDKLNRQTEIDRKRFLRQDLRNVEILGKIERSEKAHHEERHIILLALDQIKEQIGAKPTIKEAE